MGIFYQDKLARSVIEKVVRTEAKEGIPLFLFTGETLLNAEPDTFRSQQSFEFEVLEKPPSDRFRNKIPKYNYGRRTPKASSHKSR